VNLACCCGGPVEVFLAMSVVGMVLRATGLIGKKDHGDEDCHQECNEDCGKDD
jgi:hypothetical protein